MSPADLDLARELRSKMPETVYDLSESWVVERDGRRVVRGRLAGMRFVFHPYAVAEWVPDLNDPTGATAGVLLAMLQESLSAADVFIHTSHGGQNQAAVKWMGQPFEGVQHFEGSTIGVALARALLAAWEAHRG